MKWVELSLILTGVLLNAVAQLSLKAGTRAIGTFSFSMENALPVFVQLMTNWSIISGLFCYAVSVVVWVMALSRVEVSVAYPMLSIGYIVNLLFAHWLFGEPLTGMRIAGILVIMVGVVMITRN